MTSQVSSSLLPELLAGLAQEESRAREPTAEDRQAFRRSEAVKGQMGDTGHTRLVLLIATPVSQQLECELIRTLIVMKETQLDVKKRKGRKEGNGRQGRS